MKNPILSLCFLVLLLPKENLAQQVEIAIVEINELLGNDEFIGPMDSICDLVFKKFENKEQELWDSYILQELEYIKAVENCSSLEQENLLFNKLAALQKEFILFDRRYGEALSIVNEKQTELINLMVLDWVTNQQGYTALYFNHPLSGLFYGSENVRLVHLNRALAIKNINEYIDLEDFKKSLEYETNKYFKLSFTSQTSDRDK